MADDGDAGGTGTTEGDTGAAELARGATDARDDDPWPIEPIEIEQPASANAPAATAPTTAAKAVRFMNSPVATFNSKITRDGRSIQRNPATSATELTTSRTNSARRTLPDGVQTSLAALGNTASKSCASTRT